MERRVADILRDYPRLLEMQRLSFSINFPGRAFHEEWFRGSLASAIQHHDVWVYEVERELVGWLWLDWSQLDVVHISHLQVEQAHWGKGIAKRILQDAVAQALERGRRSITLNVTKSNERAMALYERFGFVKAEDHGERQFMRLQLTREDNGESARAG